MKIAVDGASAAGKSTVCKELSKKLNILYLDTGAMYRAAGLAAHQKGLGTDENSANELLKTLDIDIKYIDGEQRVFLDKRDVSAQIRQHFVSKLASDISAVPAIRLFMVELQRKIAAQCDCILDGRDIGTYVLPDAEYKFFLSADVDERAKRRYAELIQKGQTCDLESIKEDIKKRDYNDSTRAFAPLKKADGAIEIDTTSMTIDGVVDKMYKEISRTAK